MNLNSFYKLAAVIPILMWGCENPQTQSGEPQAPLESSETERSSEQDTEERDLDQEVQVDTKSHEDAIAPTTVEVPETPQDCPSAVGTFPDDPTPMNLITYINAQTAPLQLRCFLMGLPHPLKLTATTSRVSVQPALGFDSPRIFIAVGKLILAIVPDGEQKHLLEFSYLESDKTSIKGEFEFPIREPLTSVMLATRIGRNDSMTGTTCAGCHTGETPADVSKAPDLFTSRALKPIQNTIISIRSLDNLFATCKGFSSDRCKLLNAMVLEAGYLRYEFPAAMDTIF